MAFCPVYAEPHCDGHHIPVVTSLLARRQLLAFLMCIVSEHERANAISYVMWRTGFSGRIAYANRLNSEKEKGPWKRTVTTFQRALMAGKHPHGLFAKSAESLPRSRYAEDAGIGFAPKPWLERGARTRDSGNLVSGSLRLRPAYVGRWWRCFSPNVGN